MREAPSYLGDTFVRQLIARALKVHAQSGDPDFERAVFRARGWDASALTRSAVPGFGTGTGESGAEWVPGSSEFLQVLQLASAFDKAAPYFRRLPLKIAAVSNIGRATAAWRDESRAMPATRFLMSRDTLKPKRCGAVSVVPVEWLGSDEPEAEQLIRSVIVEAVAAAVDVAAFGGGAGDSDTPVSVLNDPISLASSGDLGEDLLAIVNAFPGNLQTAIWIASPAVAAIIGVRGGGGVGAAVGVTGGEMLRAPLFTTDALQDSDIGILALLDAQSVAYVAAGLDVAISRDVLVEMDSAPAGRSDTPTAASASMVSVWQTESVAIKVVRRLNFKRVGEVSAVVLTGAAYPAP